MAKLFLLFFCWSFLGINKSLGLIASEYFSVVKQEYKSGDVYILDSGFLKVFPAGLMETPKSQIKVNVTGDVKMFEIIHMLSSVQVVICSGHLNVDCYLVDVERRQQENISVDVSAQAVVDQTTPENSVICNPGEQNSSATVYLCVTDSCGNNHQSKRKVHLLKLSHRNRKMVVVCSSFEMKQYHAQGYCGVKVFSFGDLVFFLLSTHSTNKTVAQLVEIRHEKPGNLTFVVVPLDFDTHFPSMILSTLYTDSEVRKSYLVSVCKNEKRNIMNFQYLSMSTVEKYLRSASSKTKKLSAHPTLPV